jgi:DeoR/GlpR family transcriptional regulator of sugar metabolism
MTPPAAKASSRVRAEIRSKGPPERAGPARPGLLAEPRRISILDWLKEEGSARVRDLAEAFGVSEATIRQDLERLETEGLITREHGGAFLRSMPQQVRDMALQHQVHMEAKRRIGRLAASLVGDGRTIILDSGSTTTEVARHLLERQDLTVVTNALNIALMMGALPSCSVHVTGGQFKAPTLSLSGERSAGFLDGLHAEVCFLATGAVSLEAGLTYPSLADLHIKRAMVRAAARVCLLADSSKIGRNAFSALGPVDLIHTLITDQGLRDEDRRGFESRGVTVLVA